MGSIKRMLEGCTVDSYDLAPVVASLDKSHKKSIGEKILCHRTRTLIGHASIAYEVDIQYNGQVK